MNQGSSVDVHNLRSHRSRQLITTRTMRVAATMACGTAITAFDSGRRGSRLSPGPRLKATNKNAQNTARKAMPRSAHGLPAFGAQANTSHADNGMPTTTAIDETNLSATRPGFSAQPSARGITQQTVPATTDPPAVSTTGSFLTSISGPLVPF